MEHPLIDKVEKSVKIFHNELNSYITNFNILHPHIRGFISMFNNITLTIIKEF